MRRYLRLLITTILVAFCLKGSAEAETLTATRKIPEGIFEVIHTTSSDGKYSSVVTWHPNAGSVEVIFQEQGERRDDRQWTLEAGYISGSALSLCRGDSTGAIELWQFVKQGSTWKLTARADLGTGTAVNAIKVIDLNTVLFTRRNDNVDRFEITDKPILRIGGPYRVVLMNGQEYWPYGSPIDHMLTRDQLKAKAAASVAPQAPIPETNKGNGSTR